MNAQDTDQYGSKPLRDILELASAGAQIWADTASLDRANVLTRLAEALEGSSGIFCRLMVDEVGKPVGEALGEVSAAVQMLRVFAAWPFWGGSGRIADQSGLAQGQVLLKSRGVAALITPWNYPLSNPVQKIAAALVTGNAIVWRPSPVCPRTSRALADIIQGLALPDGVFSTVFEDGPEGAIQLVADTRISTISFTGSTKVGTEIYTTGSARMANVQCEMGGKNAAVVLSDANIEEAAKKIAVGAFGFAGQKCTAVSRVLVETGVRDQFIEALRFAVGSLGFGNPANKDTIIGPVINQDKSSELQGVCEAAERRGLLRCPIDQTVTGDVSGPCYFAPTVFLDVPIADPLMQKEFFGPILSIGNIADLEHAINDVNASDYGLAAAIFTRDRAKALKFARAVQVGTVKVNEATPGLSVGFPATGWKSSGAGLGELADESIRFFTKPTTVFG